jgi:hypothetical protein
LGAVKTWRDWMRTTRDVKRKGEEVGKIKEWFADVIAKGNMIDVLVGSLKGQP